MADITLGDYAGFIFLELIKAREMADEYSRQVAERYRQDPILEHFSVPRFKIPKMELTVPVLVSGASYSQTIRFKPTEDEFLGLAKDQLDELIRNVAIRARDGLFVRPRTRPGQNLKAMELTKLLYRELSALPDQLNLESIVTLRWADLVRTWLAENDLLDAYEEADRDHELLRKSTSRMLATVQTNMVVDRTVLESLLISPETNVVKNGSSESSVFSIKAEMIEEGFFLRSVKDEQTGATKTIVEFD